MCDHDNQEPPMSLEAGYESNLNQCSIIEQQAMLVALSEAMRAFAQQEVPIGAAILYQGQLIAQAANRVEQQQQASAHAEMLCLKEAARKIGNWRLKDAVLISTLEPCAMCWGAIHLYRVKKLIFGARDFKHGFYSAIHPGSPKYPNHTIEVVGDVMAKPAKALMQAFFRLRRSRNIKGGNE